MSCTCPQPPPAPYVMAPNPAFARWVERHAIELCVDAHDVDALPCAEHLHKAREAGLLWAGIAQAAKP